MPTVPQYGGPQVAQRPLTPVEAPLAAFGGGEAARAPGLGQFTEQAVAIWQDEKRKSDQVAVTFAASQLSDLETKLSIATKQKLGKDAFTAHDDVSQSWQDETVKIEAGLSNDDQRAAFQNSKAAHWNQLNNAVQNHVADQRKTYDTETTNGYLTNESDAAINADTNTPEGLARVSLAIGNTSAAIKDFGRRNGLPPELVDAHVKESASKIHTAVIDRMLANDQDLLASSYFKEHKDEIVGEQKINVEKALEEGSLRGQSQRKADEIMASTSPGTDPMDRVKEITDPKLRDAVRVRVQDEVDRLAQKRGRAREGFMVQAGNIIDRTHSVNSIPPSLWVTFEPGEKSSLRSYAKSLSGGSGDDQPKTDWETFYSLRSMAASDDSRDKFLSRNLMMDRARLGNTEFKQLVDLQGSMRTGDDKVDDHLHTIRTNDQIVTDTMNQVGLGNNFGSRNVDKPFMATIRRSIDAQVEQEQARTGKPVTSKEVQRITDEILTQRVISEPGMLWGRNEKKKRLYEMAPDDSIILSVKDIPASDRAALTSRLRQRGLPVTDQTLVDNYRKYLSGLVSRGPQ